MISGEMKALPRPRAPSASATRARCAFLSNPAVRSDLVALINGLKPGDRGRPLVEIRGPFWRIAGAQAEPR